ncbi:hypothetical protein BaRGS_00004466 [Batillaria attramentaria]|uniref:Uncharacterized protein n=1 Tax=Batillaria attramentaria TaxID=370345 RepID=A0ABD0LYV5_9CAEN
MDCESERHNKRSECLGWKKMCGFLALCFEGKRPIYSEQQVVTELAPVNFAAMRHSRPAWRAKLGTPDRREPLETPFLHTVEEVVQGMGEGVGLAIFMCTYDFVVHVQLSTKLVNLVAVTETRDVECVST